MFEALKRCARHLLAWLACSLPAAGALAADIVDADHVAQALQRGAIVWDVRDAKAYAEGHLPGAVNVGDIATVLRDPNREDWLPAAQVAAVLGRAGIDLLEREVIAYGRQGDPNAYYALSGMRHFGARDPKVFHGGLDAWQAAGRPLTKEPSLLAPVALALQPRGGTLIDNAEMIQRIRAGGGQLVDVRTPKEFSGEDVRAIRGGHLPGAVNLPYEQNWIDPDTAAKLASGKVRTRDGMALRPAAELRRLYAALDPDKEVVVYCQSGVRASVTATVLRDLGFKDVKVYEPSWLGYAGLLNQPAEREVFVNVGALNGRIGALTRRVGELEAELARIKAAR
ncbi:MAG: sulfurtransferase [Ideonella sp.]|nr:sulfurtransferase [Ideonella sp.]MCC7458469.1 sulfurtransferase [Nitrospira sp.]